MRIRAGILEHPSVELLRFVDLVGRSVWVYGQKRDLVAARRAGGQQIIYGADEVDLHDVTSDRPYVTFTVVRTKPGRRARHGQARLAEDLPLLMAGRVGRCRPVHR
jgi:hypothetical protein